MALIGEAQAERARLATEMNRRLAALTEQIEARIRGLRAWCEERRAELIGKGRAPVYRFAAGEAEWRLRPSRCTAANGLCARSQPGRNGAHPWLRLRQECEAGDLLGESGQAASNPGRGLGPAGEDFVVRPFETDVEEVMPR